MVGENLFTKLIVQQESGKENPSVIMSWGYLIQLYMDTLICNIRRLKETVKRGILAIPINYLFDFIREDFKYYFADFVRKGGGGGYPPNP